MTAARIEAILARCPEHVDALRVVALAGPVGAWIGAGFVRNAVWDSLTGQRPDATTLADIDVIHLDAGRPESARDVAAEAALRAARRGLPWSVTNQARMAMRHGHAPYAGIEEAIAPWPETATAVAVRLVGGALQVMAPHGLDDLFALVVRPSPAHAADARAVRARIAAKQWRARWPGLRMIGLDDD